MAIAMADAVQSGMSLNRKHSDALCGEFDVGKEGGAGTGSQPEVESQSGVAPPLAIPL